MATKLTKFKTGDYGIIPRGCSFTIPVSVRDEYDQPLDLTGYKAAFTIKRYQQDFDRHDDFVFCKKDFEIENPTRGYIYVQLTSKDTDFDPGDYYFDVELYKSDGVVWRVVTLKFKLDGGPTNRHINPGAGQLVSGDTISVITMTQGTPIIVVAPTLLIPKDYSELFTAIDTAVNLVEELVGRVETLEQRLEELQNNP